MAEKHVHKVYGSFPPWGKSVEFPANGGGYEYYTKPSDLSWSSFINLSSVAKVQRENYIEFIPPIKLIFTNTDSKDIIALGFDMSLRVSDEKTGELNTIKNILNTDEDSSNELARLTRITEEEFYKIPTQFTFILDGEPKWYDYKEGMTWGEWIDSPYNDGNFSVHDANMGEGIQEYVHYEYSAITDNEYYYVKPTDLIQPNMNYVVNNQVG